MASGEYPLLSRVVLDAEGPHREDSDDWSFEQGLERVLDGLAARIGDDAGLARSS